MKRVTQVVKIHLEELLPSLTHAILFCIKKKTVDCYNIATCVLVELDK